MKFFSFILFLIGCSHHQHHGHHPQNMDMHHDFSDAEKWSKRFDDPERDTWQKPQDIVRVMQLKEGDRVADIGAGTGYLMPHLVRAVGKKGKVYALDVEPNLIEFMQRRVREEELVNVEPVLIPYNSAGPSLSQVNKVVILNTWHHISNRKEYALSMHRTLPHGATVTIIEPEKGKGGPGPKDHHRSFYSDTAQDFEQVGFKCFRPKETLEYQYMVSCRK